MKLFAPLFLFITLACQCLAQNYTATWEKIYPKISPELRRYHSMVQITENKVLMFGGQRLWYDSLEFNYNDTWIFDLKDRSWTKLDTKVQPSERYGHDMVLIDSNTVFMYGGVSKDRLNYQREVWYFDIQKLQWENILTDTIDSPPKFIWWAMCKMSNDTIIISGYDVGCCEYDFFYNIKQKKWYKDKVIRELETHNGWKFIELNERELMTFGGFNSNRGIKNHTWIMNKYTLDWKEIYPKVIPQKLHSYAMQRISKNNAFVFGGFVANDSCSTSKQLFLFDYEQNNWFNITPKLSPLEVTGHAMAKLNDSTFIMYSGDAGCDEFIPENGTWLLHLKRIATSIDSELISNEIEFKETQNMIHVNNLESGTTIQIIDILGNLVEIKQVINNAYQINKLDYPIGVFLVRIQIGNKIFTNKFKGLR